MCTQYDTQKIKYQPLTLQEFYNDKAWFARLVDAQAAQLRARTETKDHTKEVIK